MLKSRNRRRNERPPNPNPSTLDARIQTVKPQPPILESKPLNRNLQSLILNLNKWETHTAAGIGAKEIKPQTPNPKPQTLNPEPRTPNPEPQTPNPASISARKHANKITSITSGTWRTSVSALTSTRTDPASPMRDKASGGSLPLNPKP
jgi:hypothetical protein